jgi:hypothetical protein
MAPRSRHPQPRFMNLVDRALDVRRTRVRRGAVLGARGTVSDSDAFEGATTQISKRNTVT